MSRSVFGWDLPPGVTQRMIDDAYGQDAPCDICGLWEDECVCPECPQCGSIGDPKCYDSHGLVRTDEQIELRAKLDAEIEATVKSEAMWADNEYVENVFGFSVTRCSDVERECWVLLATASSVSHYIDDFDFFAERPH